VKHRETAETSDDVERVDAESTTRARLVWLSRNDGTTGATPHGEETDGSFFFWLCRSTKWGARYRRGCHVHAGLLMSMIV